MGKGINKDSMSNLMASLTTDCIDTVTTDRSKTTIKKHKQNKKEQSSKNKLSFPPTSTKEKVCFSLDHEIVDKIRVISSSIDNVTMSMLLSLGAKIVIEKYEKLYGKIIIPEHKTLKVEDLF